MNTNLKRLAGAAIAAFAIAIGANAQESRPGEKAFIRKYALEMFASDLQGKEIPGIVESTLYTLVQCKNRYPELDYSHLIDAVNKLAKEHDNLAIGYRASLVGLYLVHSSDFHITPISSADNHEYLFKQIADQLEQKLVAMQSEETTMAEIK